MIKTCQKINLLYSTLAKSQLFEPRISSFQEGTESSGHHVLGFLQKWFILFLTLLEMIAGWYTSRVQDWFYCTNTGVYCVSGAFPNEWISTILNNCTHNKWKNKTFHQDFPELQKTLGISVWQYLWNALFQLLQVFYMTFIRLFLFHKIRKQKGQEVRHFLGNYM